METYTLNDWEKLVEQDVIRNIPGYDSDYWVDRTGRIYSTKKSSRNPNRNLLERKSNDDHRGYLVCGLKRNDGVKYPLKVHHAVLYAFLGPRPSPEHVAMHEDDNSYNNTLENLRWGTTQENQESKVKNRSTANAHKRKLDSEKRKIVKRILDSNVATIEEIHTLTQWPIEKIKKEISKLNDDV